MLEYIRLYLLRVLLVYDTCWGREAMSIIFQARVCFLACLCEWDLFDFRESLFFADPFFLFNFSFLTVPINPGSHLTLQTSIACVQWTTIQIILSMTNRHSYGELHETLMLIVMSLQRCLDMDLPATTHKFRKQTNSIFKFEINFPSCADLKSVSTQSHSN